MQCNVCSKQAAVVAICSDLERSATAILLVYIVRIDTMPDSAFNHVLYRVDQLLQDPLLDQVEPWSKPWSKPWSRGANRGARPWSKLFSRPGFSTAKKAKSGPGHAADVETIPEPPRRPREGNIRSKRGSGMPPTGDESAMEETAITETTTCYHI